MDLFGNKNEIIRTLGFYQPFGSLMLHDKIETRWVKKGKKPPFPLGKYAFYTTEKYCSPHTLLDWCGEDILLSINSILSKEPTRNLTKHLIGYGTLIAVRPLIKEDESLAFVKFQGQKTFFNKDMTTTIKCQWALFFKNVKAIIPVTYNHGKQGVGFLDKQYLQYL